MADNQNSASMLGGHAQYVKGVAEETVGSVTGNSEWSQSGAQHKEEAVKEMRAANQDSAPTDTSTYSGKASDALGKAVGCEGMQADTEQSETQQGEDRYATTSGEH